MAAVPGATIVQQAVRIAGALAELGQTSLTLITPQGKRGLSARETDLPRVIVEVAESTTGMLYAPDIWAVFILSPSGLTWECTDSVAQAELAKRLSA